MHCNEGHAACINTYINYHIRGLFGGDLIWQFGKFLLVRQI